MEIVSLIEQSSYFKAKLAALKNDQKVSFFGLVGSSKAAILAALDRHLENLLIVSSTTGEAERLKNEIEFFSDKPAKVFPALDVLPDGSFAPSKEVVGERITILEGWLAGKKGLVIAPVKAFLQKTSKNIKAIDLSPGKNIKLEDLIAGLINFGFKRFDIVGERGEFSVRGGIIDIFPLDRDNPVRLEMVGDQVESLRLFEAYSQRSIDKIAEVSILPAFEKPEASLLEVLPKGTTLVIDEPLEVNRAAGSPVNIPAQIELSCFLSPGEEVFEGLESLPAIPPRKIRPAIREGVAEELLADLKIGDYVVHENYGIGIYRGINFLEIDDVKQEYLLIEYAEEDKLYVPPHMIGLVEKFSGGRETKPRLSRLGTKQWLQTRSRVKQSLRDLTQELLELYAAREKFEGYAYPPDDIWQKELESTFPYDATPDQNRAITAVKKDMETPRPMDRLVCGDVGYGKTEVAIRAAAKAVASGKQVAILAPTTILVEQHYNNFKRRFQNLPFVVEMLSRFRSAKEQKEVVKLIEAGGVDIVIGTHRLLSKDIKFKDLGLLVVDEEQKFGVSHKEKLKKLRKNVDVLTLTATPIPRTLYFSLSGLREISMISTAPVDRSPIRTYVIPFSETVIREGILRELDRGGQVYFVHNFVETIQGMAARIKRLVPEARIVVAHGQMDEKALEKTMLDFLERRHDVLVCTSIIESGLDISSVNTILIDQADRFGLSQLYQIRGRVGRSAVRAHAYLFYHPARNITDGAMERLKAIQEFTALGSGYKIAMRDLEIRGSGNLLGAQQSGHIYEVGFDLYCELLEEAVKEAKGEPAASYREVEIDLKVEASIPSNYVNDERQRIALYRRMSLVTSPVGIEDMRKEMEDRFGKIPPQIETLFRLIKLKLEALRVGVKKIKEEDGKIRIEWLSKKVKLLDISSGDRIKIALIGIAR